MKEIKVEKEKLLTKLKDNREEHKKLVEKAKIGFKKQVKEKLEELLKKVDQDKKINLHELNEFDQPIDKTEEYDRAIEMLEMSVDKVVVVSQNEFKCFIQDDWSWSREMAFSNMKYAQ